MGSVRVSGPGWTALEIGLLALGVLLIVLGALLGKLWESQLDSRFYKEMVLSETSEGYNEWMSPTVDIISRIYLWNWTNPEAIGSTDYKPQFQEVGPYVFREKHHKANVSWNINGTVTYKTLKYWYFVPELSAGNLTDRITSVNTVAATLSYMSLNWNFFARRSLSLALLASKQKIYWTHTVGELTFDGFDNPIVKLGSYMSSSTKPKFGYFFDMNGTLPNDFYNMATGAHDIFTIGQVGSINFLNTTSAHDGNCSIMQGSLGEFWPPASDSNSKLVMYTPDMCRSISYYYDGESQHNDIDALVFASTLATVDNGSMVEDNLCFCHDSGCVPSGVFDLRSCREDAPVFMSFPHLYLADPVYHEGVHGLHPDPDKHKFYIKIEPRTGVPLEVAARLQLNVKIVKNSGLTVFREIQDVVVPVFWIETIASLPETHTSGVKLFLNIIKIGPFIYGCIIAVGTFFLVVLTSRHYLKKHCTLKEASSLPTMITLNPVLDDPSKALSEKSEKGLCDESKTPLMISKKVLCIESK